MAPKEIPCAKYQYVVTPEYGPKIIAVESKDEESAADYNYGGYLPIKLHDSFKDGRYKVVRKLGCVAQLFFHLLLSHCFYIFQMGSFLDSMAHQG